MIEKEEVSESSTSGPTNLAFATLEKQQARAFLRERFLRVITGIVGKKHICIHALLHNEKQSTLPYQGCDVETSEIFVKNLETPMGTIPEAILRHSDIIHLDVGDIDVAE